MIELPPDSPRAVLVHINFRSGQFNEELDEFRDLVASSGVLAVDTVICSKNVPHPRYFIGEGKVDDIRQLIASHAAEIVIFNHAMSPAQERNLEQALNCRVIDRVELILDIFAQRARSYEGKLQVELAQLQRLSTRLIRGWTHLERQKGGIGLRGPGETQLETDRRLIGKRIKHINNRLQRVRSQRRQSAKQRTRSSIPVVSLVGYTNVGKSTLFNRLSGADVYAANKLFATLDPTLRRFTIPPATDIILTDTVGFIRHLPHDLINAFHATLDETRHADLLLHVIDAGDPDRHAHIEQVNEVIERLGADRVPQIEVYNKIDQDNLPARVELDGKDRPHRVWLSARSGQGLELLFESMRHYLTDRIERHRLNLPASAGKLRARLFDIGVVENEQLTDQGGWLMDVYIETPRLHRICNESGLPAVELQL